MSPTGFSITIGTGFLATATLAAIAGTRLLRTVPRGDQTARLVFLIGVALVIALLYTVYGAARSAPMSAGTYFRNTSAMLLALLIGLDLGRTWNYRTFAVIYLASLPVGLLLSGIELVVPYTYYSGIGAIDYFGMRRGGIDLTYTVRDLVVGRTVTWFNITGGAGNAVSVRLLGPNMHSISYAYVLAVGGVVSLTLRKYGVAALMLGLLMMAGIKGALLMLTATIGLSTLWAVTGRRNLVLLAASVTLLAYVASGVVIGMRNGDFHVIGLIGGINGFVRMPWGHGIGVGGNLSTVAESGLNWQEFQHVGADFALESAVGVLLYQMGIGCAAIYFPLLTLLLRGFGYQAKRGRRALARVPRPTDALFLGIAVTLANGIFQEEAYSPYALGLLMLAGGIAFSNTAVAARMRKEVTA